jgi:hypothetical protein
LSKCNLDIDEPRLTVIGGVSSDSLRGGLEQLRDRLARDHHMCGFFSHPMPGFPDYYNKVWEWDFRPTGERSFTRGGWRLLAYVPDPRGPEPILARPFICWDKGDAPSGNQEHFISGALKKFLSQHIRVEAEEETFQVRVDRDGTHYGTCQLCWDHVASADRDELDTLMSAHKSDCPGHPPD